MTLETESHSAFGMQSRGVATEVERNVSESQWTHLFPEMGLAYRPRDKNRYGAKHKRSSDGGTRLSLKLGFLKMKIMK